MRIGLVGPVYPYRGGIAHYTAKLCHTLRNQGHEVLLASFKRQYPRLLFPGRTDIDPSTTSLRVTDAEYRLDSLNPVSWLRTAGRLKEIRPDVIVMQWWTTFLAPVWLTMALVLRNRTQFPLIFVCHNVMPHEERLWDRSMARAVLSRGTHFIVQSSEEERQLHGILPGAESAIVPLPIFDLGDGCRMSKGEARTAIGVPADVPLLLFFGIVREYKGLMDLLEAIPEVIRRVGKVQLIIAGEFWEPRARYERKIHELGIQDSIRIDDRYIPDEDVSSLFCAADLVVAPHRRATGSGVVQIAVGLGVPLLTTLDWLFKDVNISGPLVIVPPGDVPALASAICDYLSGPRPVYDLDAAEALRARFSWEHLADAIVGTTGSAIGS